jgi:hypothetical protein
MATATIDLAVLESVLEILSVSPDRVTTLELLQTVQAKTGTPLTPYLSSVRPPSRGSDAYDTAVAAFKSSVNAAV